MNLYGMSIVVVLLSNVLYHVFQKSIPSQFNPFISLIVSYLTAILFSLILFLFYPSNISFSENFKLSLMPSIALGFAIVGLEFGFLLAYRAGWNISIAAMFSNVAVAIFLLPIGLLMYKEHFTRTNALGVVFCIIGLVLVRR